MINQFKLRSTIKYPTSIIVNGLSPLGLEVADSLLAQGGYVILVDAYNPANLEKLNQKFGSSSLVSFLDYSAIPHLQEDIRRLDYVFYLSHVTGFELEAEISTQSFLKYSNYLDTMLDLTSKFEAKFLLTTSIRAHQMLMSHLDLDINFGIGSQSKHTVYTEMEVQRYAESLCLEYATKKNLNVRIVRMAEVIGEGMDFAAKTAFTKLALAAISGKDLELWGDGLDTDWYVHMLDAAYGVIKAQFSKDTEGEIFSLAYDTNVTHLSLAYKIQEIEPNAKEIVFADNSSGLPPIRLHKPAPNLAKIGWKPRIDFEKAIAESLAAAKLHLLQNENLGQNSSNEDTGVVKKIRSFFNIAAQNPTPAELEMLSSGPVSRLIAERKQQERMRMESLGNADSKIKSTWRERQRTPAQKFKAWVWRNFLDARTNFGFLRQMTPFQFFGYVVLGVIVLFLYFNFFAPVIVLGRNLIVAVTNYPGLVSAAQASDFNQVNLRAGAIAAALQENLPIMTNLQPIAQLVKAGNQYESAWQLTKNLQQIFSGIEDLAYANQPLQEYLKNYTDNTRFRLNNETYLATVEPAQDYNPYLADIQSRIAYAEAGKEKMSQGIAFIQQTDFSVWPEVIQNQLNSFTADINKLASFDSNLALATYLPDLLGSNGPRTYLFVLMDNSRPMPMGGVISAYMTVTFQNGGIADLRLQSIDAFSPSMQEVSDTVLQEINLTSFTTKNKANTVLTDLAYLSNPRTFAGAATQVWSEALNRTVDGVILVNLNYLEKLLTISGEVQVDGQVFLPETLLTGLADLQTATPTSQRRNDMIAQIWAISLEKILDRWNANFLSLAQAASLSVTNKDIVLADLSVPFARQVAARLDNYLQGTDVPLAVAFTADAKQLSPSRYPAINQAVKYNVNADLTVAVSYVVRFPAVPGVDHVTFCTGANSTQLELKGLANQAASRKTKNSERNCIMADITTETELSFSFLTSPIASLDQKEYNIAFGISRNSGSEAISDFEVAINPSFRIETSSPEVSLVDGGLAFTQTLVGDQIIKIKLVK